MCEFGFASCSFSRSWPFWQPLISLWVRIFILNSLSATRHTRARVCSRFMWGAAIYVLRVGFASFLKGTICELRHSVEHHSPFCSGKRRYATPVISFLHAVDFIICVASDISNLLLLGAL